MKLNFTKNNKGFTVLFSVIVSAIVLSIGISIANITLKQIVISSAGRESQIAFYAADSGAECAIYHDLMGEDVFATSTLTTTDFECFGQVVSYDTDDIGVDPVELGSNSATTTFMATFPGSTYCAIVTVGKHDLDTVPDGFIDKTIIQSRGYNICIDPDNPNPRTLERGLEIFY